MYIYVGPCVWLIKNKSYIHMYMNLMTINDYCRYILSNQNLLKISQLQCICRHIYIHIYTYSVPSQHSS